MTLWYDVARVAIAVNLLLLLGLGYVWAGNYRRFRSKHALGLLLFAVMLFLENAVALYLYMLDPVMSAWMADVPVAPQRLLTLLRVFEAVALAFIAWVTWD
ncbi:hypothetical protein [Halostella litorea]|uniref:hypothetical protein n=1 Tax=Halostella litorea TaxID=2528831 RepID=UPI0010925074|nr:hypothetical protein [Halostella litorea]